MNINPTEQVNQTYTNINRTEQISIQPHTYKSTVPYRNNYINQTFKSWSAVLKQKWASRYFIYGNCYGLRTLL